METARKRWPGNGVFIRVFNAIGVVHDCSHTQANVAGIMHVKCDCWNGTQGSNDFGDASQAAASNFGTGEFMFIENCNITMDLPSNHLTCIDSQAGGRYVLRYCSLTKAVIDGHGLEAQRERSTRCIEVYNNVFTGNDSGQAVTYIRGGHAGTTHQGSAEAGETYPTWPDPWVESIGLDREYSIYVVYTPSGGATPLIIPMTLNRKRRVSKTRRLG